MRENGPRFPSLASLVLALAFLLPPAGLAAQRSPVLRVLPFAGESLLSSELSALQSLVTSAAIELGAFRVVDSAGQELALREVEFAAALGAPAEASPLVADYLLAGSVLPAGGGYVFALELTRVGTGEKRAASEIFATRNEVVLAARSLTRELFARASLPQAGPVAAARGNPEPGSGRAPPPPASPAAPPSAPSPAVTTDPAPSLQKIAGTWAGDKGVERVNLFPDGRGIALLGSGATMKLRATARGSTVEVVQDQANLPEFYRGPGIDLGAARSIAAAARPWRWIFVLAADGGSLRGVKESQFVSLTPGAKPVVDNAYAREALWTRLSR